jgi:phosphatidylglycerol:prolipoprotein diacylglycerol transferase
MHPILLSTDLFGFLSEPFELHTYGVMIAIGFLAAMLLGSRQGRLEGEDPDRIIDLAFYVLLAGLVGARVVFIITKLPEYIADPVQILYFWRGGLVWYGGFIGAALFTIHYCRKHRMSYWKIVDISIPYVALAHAFGRFGCLSAGCCYGRPTESFVGIQFPVTSAVQYSQQSDGLVGFTDLPHPVHPTQLYEAGFEISMFLLLIAMRPHKRFHGQLFLIWLSAYPIARTIIEMVRGDKERGVFVLSTSQWISILVAAAAVGLIFYFRRESARQGQLVAET